MMSKSTADMVVLGGDINSDPRQNKCNGRNLKFVGYFQKIKWKYIALIRMFTFS